MPERVLLLTPQFYGIEKIIKSVLEESHFEVTWFENKSSRFDYHGTKSKLKLLRRIYFFLFSPHIRYIKRELKKIGNTKFDIFLSINANVICPFLLKKLKRENPELYSVLYLWDSFSMNNWIKELKLFDKVFTFDKADSTDNQIEYKPNFFVRSNIAASHENIYDLFFVGKFSPDRLAVIDKIINRADISGIKCFLKLWPAYKILFHNRMIYNIFQWLNFKNIWVQNYQLNFEAVEGITKREYLVTESMDYSEMQYQLLCSNVVLDLPYRWQTGYTHRLVEALANGKKVITTNSDIRNEKFYNPMQIKIINEQNPEIDYAWIKEKATFPVDDYFLDLELSLWVNSIINVGIA